MRILGAQRIFDEKGPKRLARAAQPHRVWQIQTGMNVETHLDVVADGLAYRFELLQRRADGLGWLEHVAVLR